MRRLKLGGLVKCWRTVPYESNEQYIHALLEAEIHERDRNRINFIVKSAGFRVVKTLEEFEWTPTVQLPQGLSREDLEQFTFLERKENLILLGAVGTGKTHLATAVALRACQAGKCTRFFTATELANLLLEKNQKGTLHSFLNTLKRTELIVIDEIGFPLGANLWWRSHGLTGQAAASDTAFWRKYPVSRWSLVLRFRLPA